MSKKLIKNKWACLYCNDIIESKHQHHFISCKCGEMSIDGGTAYIRLIGDLDMMENLCECIEIWQDGDKIKCIDNKGVNSLEFGKVYTVDTSMNTADNRVWLKEVRRFSFLKSRFELVEE